MRILTFTLIAYFFVLSMGVVNANESFIHKGISFSIINNANNWEENTDIVFRIEITNSSHNPISFILQRNYLNSIYLGDYNKDTLSFNVTIKNDTNNTIIQTTKEKSPPTTTKVIVGLNGTWTGYITLNSLNPGDYNLSLSYDIPITTEHETYHNKGIVDKKITVLSEKNWMNKAYKIFTGQFHHINLWQSMDNSSLQIYVKNVFSHPVLLIGPPFFLRTAESGKIEFNENWLTIDNSAKRPHNLILLSTPKGIEMAMSSVCLPPNSQTCYTYDFNNLKEPMEKLALIINQSFLSSIGYITCSVDKTDLIKYSTISDINYGINNNINSQLFYSWHDFFIVPEEQLINHLKNNYNALYWAATFLWDKRYLTNRKSKPALALKLLSQLIDNSSSNTIKPELAEIARARYLRKQIAEKESIKEMLEIDSDWLNENSHKIKGMLGVFD